MTFTRYTEIAKFPMNSLSIEKRKTGAFGKDTYIVLIINGVDFVADNYANAWRLSDAIEKKEGITCTKTFAGNAADEYSETFKYKIFYDVDGWIYISKI